MKTNENLVKVVAGVLSSSVLASSCTQYLPPDSYVYGNVNIDDSDLGQLVIPISLHLRYEDVLYIKAIQDITTNIIDSPQKAREFCENPKSVLAQYGYHGEINLDDGMIKMTMGLADTDIYDAVKNKDFKLFINHCIDKGIMSSNTILSNDYYKDQLDKIYQSDKFKKFQEELNKNTTLKASSITKSFLLVAIAAVAVGFVAAVAYFVYAVNALWVALATPNNLNPDLGTLDIYALREGMENTYIAVDSYTEEMVDYTIATIKEASPEYFETHSEIETRNLIKVNIINNL